VSVSDALFIVRYFVYRPNRLFSACSISVCSAFVLSLLKKLLASLLCALFVADRNPDDMDRA